jgi:glutaredoxin-like protein NrdH
MAVNHIAGKDAGHIMLYALSTCGWCAKTRQLLEEIGVGYDYEYVDQVQGTEKQGVIQKVQKWNPACSFPTLVINDKKCIVGYLK